MIHFLILLIILTILSSVAALYIILHELIKKVKAINDKILTDQAATVQRIHQVRKEIEAATTPRHIIR